VLCWGNHEPAVPRGCTAIGGRRVGAQVVEGASAGGSGDGETALWVGNGKQKRAGGVYPQRDGHTRPGKAGPQVPALAMTSRAWATSWTNGGNGCHTPLAGWPRHHVELGTTGLAARQYVDLVKGGTGVMGGRSRPSTLLCLATAPPQPAAPPPAASLSVAQPADVDGHRAARPMAPAPLAASPCCASSCRGH